MNLTKYPLINGLILGTVAIVINQFAFSKIFVPDANLGLIPLYSLLFLIILPILSIILATRSVLKTRNFYEGQITFKVALNSAFVTFLIGSLIAILHVFIYANYINPALGENIKEMAIEALKQQPGEPEEIKEQIAMFRELNMHFKFNVMISYLLTSSIIGFIISLIIAAIVKKDINQIPE